MKILELGNYVVPAYAGMILAEQGHSVRKWTNGRDPILGLNKGAELWAWINQGKTIEDIHPQHLLGGQIRPDVIIDNFRPETLEKWGIDPVELAKRFGLVWVSMRSDVGDRSFDLLAQARSWMEYAPWVPFWAGDTIGGLWLAFKALAMYAASSPGHYTLAQASCMQKLVEGELIVERPAHEPGSIPWETEPYRFHDGNAVVQYKGDTYREPVRDRAWKLANLRHSGGRMII
jgi:crotonobetainyl-CoA:carnitine CoA-transferase CaiB-like acyl-CoA transferase